MNLKLSSCIAIFICLVATMPGFAEGGTPDKLAPANANQQESQPVQQQPAPKNDEAPPQQVGQPPEQQKDTHPVEATTIFEQTGVLTPRGTFVLEPSLQYAHSSSNRIALVGYTYIPSVTIGLIDIRNVESNTLVAALSVRYGITNRLELETKIPYVYRTESSATQSTTNSVAQVFSADGNGIGDVEFALRYQLNQPSGNDPYYIIGLRIKSDTGKDPFDINYSTTVAGAGGQLLPTELPNGSGFWGIQPSLTAIFPSDPVVFFGSFSYMWNAERQVDTGPLSLQGRYDPGDIIGFNFGMGLSLNEKASFSIGYDHSVVGKVKQNGVIIPGSLISQVGSLLIGYSYKYNEKTSYNLSIAAGLTQAAPDVQLTLRVPINF